MADAKVGLLNATAGDPPNTLKFDAMIMDVCCHPTRDIVAVGDIDGEVSVHSYSTPGPNHQLMSFSHHNKSCRRVRFNSDGSRLVTASKDKSLSVIDMTAGTVTQTMKRAHESAIYCLLVVDDNIAATGDDDGTVKVWDFRQQRAVMELHESEEYLTDMVVDRTKRILLATSGEGTLTAFDIRKHKMIMQSELLDSGLLSIAVVKSGSKVVCGSDEGVINIFNWGEWGNISDRFPGHPMSIDAVVPITDSIICTGASDGVIRAVSILPNRIIGVVGRHDDAFPVEALSVSHCGRWLASCSHDQCVLFSDVRRVRSQSVDGHKKLKRERRPVPLSARAAAVSGADFFDGLAPGDAATTSTVRNDDAENFDAGNSDSDESDECGDESKDVDSSSSDDVESSDDSDDGVKQHGENGDVEISDSSDDDDEKKLNF